MQMVNGEFPARARYGFERVDFRGDRVRRPSEKASTEIYAWNNSAFFLQNFGKLNPMQALAIYRRPLVRLSTARQPKNVID
jgi:hypothetical protein